MNRILLAFAALIAAPAIAQEAAPKPQTVLGPKTTNSAAIDTVTGPAKYRYPKKYDGYVLRDYTVTSSSFGVRNNDGSEITIDRGNWRDTGSPEKIGAVFALGGSGSLNLRNVTATGNYDPKKKVKTEFPNRDVVMGAQRTFLTIENGTLKNAYDASIDTKATTTLKGVVRVEGSRVGLKDWGPLTGDTLDSRYPRDGHIACLTSPVVTCSIYLRKLIAWDDNPNGLLIGFQGNDGVVRIDECELHVPASYRISWIKPGSKNTKVILGPSCVKDGNVVVAPLKPVADTPVAQIVDAGQLLPDNTKDGLIRLAADWAGKLKVKTGTVVRHLDGFRYQVVR